MKHLQNIEADINWLSTTIEERIKDINFNINDLEPPAYPTDSFYADFIIKNGISNTERLFIILTLVPNIYPVFLYDKFNAPYNKSANMNSYSVTCPNYHSAIVKSEKSDSFLPTGQTFLYLAGGNNLEKRAEIVENIYESKYHTIATEVIFPTETKVYEPLLSNLLLIKLNYVLSFTLNNIKYLQTNNKHGKV